MAATPGNPTTRKSRWYIPTPAKYLLAVLLMQGVLFLSAHYRWFWFNERKGYTVLIAVAATVVALLLLAVTILVSRFFKSKAQFSLAALLLMVPVTAIPCGWFVRELDLARQQQKSIAIFNHRYIRIGANAYDDYILGGGWRTRSPPGSAADFLERSLGRDFFHDIVRVTVNDDLEFEQVASFRNLREISINRAHVTDVDMARLAPLHELHVLKLEAGSASSQVTGNALKYMKHLTQMRELDLGGIPINDSECANLAGMTHLKFLRLDGSSHITNLGLEKLKGLKEIETLSLRNSKITDAGVEHLQGFQNLKQLFLDDTAVTDAGLQRLKHCPQLTYVSLKRTKITRKGATDFRQVRPHCLIDRDPERSLLWFLGL